MTTILDTKGVNGAFVRRTAARKRKKILAGNSVSREAHAAVVVVVLAPYFISVLLTLLVR